MTLTFEDDSKHHGALVAKSGDVVVGRIFAPIPPYGKRRWRMWINGRSQPDVGLELSTRAAKEGVQRAWQVFLDRARLSLNPVDKQEVAE